jgi:hypothetical protein
VPPPNIENLPIFMSTANNNKMTYNVKMKLRAETCSKANTRIYIYAIFIDTRHRNYMHATITTFVVAICLGAVHLLRNAFGGEVLAEV